MFQQIAYLSRSTLDRTTKYTVADLRVTTCSRLKGERRIDGRSKQVPCLTDTLLSRLQVRMGIGN